MKKPELQNRPKMEGVATAFRRIFVAALGCLLTASARAEVHIIRCDPPVAVDAFAEPAPGLNWNTTAFDFDLDGQPDFRLTYGSGIMTAYFNSPTAVGVRTLPPFPPPPGSPVPNYVVEAQFGPVGVVPLGSVIGSNIVSSVGTNFFTWSPGYTNTDNFPELLGDHQMQIMFVNLAVPIGPEPQPVISLSTNGTFVTNIYNPIPFVFGDVVGKEGVMALQFYTGNERHYGYIHFNFKGAADGMGGIIYGWAYETQPDVPIQAVPLSPAKVRPPRIGRPGNSHGRPGR